MKQSTDTAFVIHVKYNGEVQVYLGDGVTPAKNQEPLQIDQAQLETKRPILIATHWTSSDCVLVVGGGGAYWDCTS